MLITTIPIIEMIKENVKFSLVHFSESAKLPINEINANILNIIVNAVFI